MMMTVGAIGMHKTMMGDGRSNTGKNNNPGLNSNIQLDDPALQYPHRASIPRAIFQGSHSSNDTSLRTEHMPPMPEQVVLSHAEFARHVVTYLPTHPNRPQSLQILNLVGIQTLQPYLVKTFVDLKKKKK